LDSGSNDDTLKICKEFKVDFIQIDVKNFDHGGTRNLGASKAEGNVIVFMTQDAIFSDTRGLENLIQPLHDNQIAASYGRQIAKENANPIERFVRSFNYPSEKMVKGIEDLPKLGIKTFFFSNACSAIKKTAFIEVGGFPNRTIMNEDMFLAAKLIMKGYKVAYQADAVVYHSHNYSLSTQFKRYFDIGVFFSQNHWIKGIAKSEREGIRYLKEEILFLFAERRTIWIPYALIDTGIRFFGYRMGLLEKRIPLFLKKRMSFNKLFWEYGNL
jgi:rhamnosyltransferase